MNVVNSRQLSRENILKTKVGEHCTNLDEKQFKKGQEKHVYMDFCLEQHENSIKLLNSGVTLTSDQILNAKSGLLTHDQLTNFVVDL